MQKNKKVILVAMIILFALAVLSTSVLAQTDVEEPEVVITFFWREGCSHCADEKPVLKELANKYPQVNLKGYEVFYSTENRDYFFALGEAIGFEANSVPVTIVGDQVWVGYSESVGEEIEAAVNTCLESGCQDQAVVNNIDTSKTLVSIETSADEVGIQKKSSFPVWIAAALLLVVLAYFVGRAKAKSKPKSKKNTSKKRH